MVTSVQIRAPKFRVLGVGAIGSAGDSESQGWRFEPFTPSQDAVLVGMARTYRRYADRAEYIKRKVTERRKLLRRRLIQMLGGKCRVCGYNKYDGALEFHHKDRATKLFSINLSEMGKSWATLVAEALKCVLLCGNCHAEVEAGVTQLPEDSPVAQG
jgi:hypothetical protein